MKHFLLLLSLIFAGSLLGTVTVPLTLEIGPGYKEDHLHWRLSIPGTPNSNQYSEEYDHLRFLHTEATLRTIQRDIYILINGGYGALGRGDLKQEFFDLAFIFENPTFNFKTSAYTYHIRGLFGYLIELTPDRHYKVNVIPYFGYAFYYEKIKRKNPSPDPLTSTAVGGGLSFLNMTSSLSSHDLRQKWYGPFIGIGIEIKPGGRITFDAAYAYHWLHVGQRFGTEINVAIFAPGPVLSSEFSITSSSKISGSGNLGHLGLLKATIMISSKWDIAVLGKYLYFTSREKKVSIDQETNSIFPPPPVTAGVQLERNFKTRWTSFLVVVQLCHRF